MATLFSNIRKRLGSLSLADQFSIAPGPDLTRRPTPPRSTLDLSDLPVEILLNLMQSVSDIYTLRSLVYCSRTLLPIYNLHRQIILNSVFGRTVDLHLMQEARFARATGRIDFSAAAGDVANQVAHYVRRYHHLRRHCEPGILTPIVVDDEQARGMTRLYSAIYALASDYCRDVSNFILTQKRLDDPAPTLESSTAVPNDRSSRTPVTTYDSLTPTEQHRLKRAFFRYEIFCNLYRDRGLYLDTASSTPTTPAYAPGLGRYASAVGHGDDFDETLIDEATKAREFLGPFEPWEVGEFAAVHKYCLRRWEGILRELEERGVEIDDTQFSGNKCHLCMLGLEFLRQFLTPIADGDGQAEVVPDEKVRLLRLNTHYEVCDPRNVVKEYKYLKHTGGCQEGGTRDGNGADGPNPGWLAIRDSDGEAKKWLRKRLGYVFWDRERLQGLEAIVSGLEGRNGFESDGEP